ncbi:MAG TPA: hypothetical protein VF131_11080 [Blastocatellia bacterium]|nr:hypothetical protein [Blastocatellia bacterium]
MICYLCQKPITAQDEVEHHHPIYKSRGGKQTAPCHKSCHRNHHRTSGDFRDWGKASAMTRAWAFNLLNVRNHPAYDFDRAYYLMNYAH